MLITLDKSIPTLSDKLIVSLLKLDTNNLSFDLKSSKYIKIENANNTAPVFDVLIFKFANGDGKLETTYFINITALIITNMTQLNIVKTFD